MITQPHRNIFSDRSSLVLRAMLRQPGKEWAVRDFLREGVSVGQANLTLNRMEHHGYVLRERRGRNSFSRLVQKEKLLHDWVQAYELDLNHAGLLHDPHREFLPRLDAFMKERKARYVLTAFSASRLISPYVLDHRHFVYADVEPEKLREFLDALQNKLGLLKLAQGGNVWIAAPYYRSSVFRDAQPAGRYPTAGRLQMFLDLMKLPAGIEEVEHLKKHFKKKGEEFV